MKKHRLTALMLCIVLMSAVLTGCEKKMEKSDIYATIPPIYDFTCKIAGDKQKVGLIAASDIHEYEPSAAEMADLADCPLIFYNGFGIDDFVQKLGESTHNINRVDVSKGIDADEHEEHEDGEHSEAHENHDHNHGGVNPHVWLYPPYAKLQMENIKNALCEFDKNNAAYYEENYQTYAAKCDELDARFKELHGKTIVVSHNAYGYWQSEYGINIVSADADGSDISPAKTKELVDFCKANSIKTIYYEFGGSDKTAKAIAGEIGGEVRALNSFESNKDGKTDYFAVMEDNLEALK